MKQQKNILNHSIVEFLLANATPNSMSVDLFDTNTLADTPTTNDAAAYPNTLGQKISMGGTYDAMAYNDKLKTIITGDALGNIKIIDVSTGLITVSTSNTVAPKKMVYVAKNDTIYSIGTAGLSTNIIGIINATTGEEKGTITIPFAAANLSDIIFCTQQNTIYVKDNSGNQKIWVITITDNSIVTSISMPVGTTSQSITYSTSNNSIYVFENTLGTIMQINCITNTIIDTIIGVGKATIGIYNSNNNQLYYRDASVSKIKIINVATNTISATSIAGFVGTITDMVYSAYSNHIWATDSAAPEINIIDSTLNVISDTLPLPILFSTGKLLYCNNINTVYATPDITALATYIQQVDSSANRFYVGGSTNYNAFVKDNLVNPKKVDRITVYGQSTTDLANALTFNYNNAAGEDGEHPKVPINKVNVMQKQGQIAQINIKDFVLDVNTFINYLIPPFTTISWIIYYKQYKRSALLSSRVKIGDSQEYTEQDLIQTTILPDWINYIEIDKILKN